jgi:hypothetical protein
MRAALFLAAPLSLLGCTMDAAETASSEGATAGELAPGQVRCIDSTRIAGRRAESDTALIFELDDGRIVRNDLPRACPGIGRASGFGTLAIDPIEARMCQGDFVRIYDPADLPVGGVKSLPRCRLGVYTPVPG